MPGDKIIGEPRPWMESDVDRLARELHERGERTMRKEKPSPVPSREGDYNVEWCAFCRCKTWHESGICEWWDTHKEPAEQSKE